MLGVRPSFALSVPLCPSCDSLTLLCLDVQAESQARALLCTSTAGSSLEDDFRFWTNAVQQAVVRNRGRKQQLSLTAGNNSSHGRKQQLSLTLPDDTPDHSGRREDRDAILEHSLSLLPLSPLSTPRWPGPLVSSFSLPEAAREHEAGAMQMPAADDLGSSGNLNPFELVAVQVQRTSSSFTYDDDRWEPESKAVLSPHWER